MNTVILIGRLTRDAKAFTTTGGAPGAVFTLAVANGPQQTSFIPCKLLGKSVKGVMPYLTKGKLVNFTGSLDVYPHATEKMSNGYPVTMFNVTGWSVELLGNDGGAPSPNSPQRQMAPNMTNTAPNMANTAHNHGGYTPQQQKAPNAPSFSDDEIDNINDAFAAAADAYGIQIEDDIGF